MLEARVAKDGQWRFHSSHQFPEKLKVAIIEFEDRGFYKHHGISMRGIGRAISQNWRNKRMVSGGSTITMQVARMLCKHKSRNIFNKIHEMIIATRLEIRYSKSEILDMYLSNAPFGNNVVGADAAAWRYYGRNANKLSWAECATLAVLPNAPGLLYPGKNQIKLTAKRNRLLKRLFDNKQLDATQMELAFCEKVPGKPLQLLSAAPHLMATLMQQNGRGNTYESTVDKSLQDQVLRIAQRHHQVLSGNQIMNGAVLVSSTKTGEILAYIGNISERNLQEGSEVDCVLAARSSGSILKPLLYESSMEAGIITPKTLLYDVPSQFGNYAPKNFNKKFEGAIPANQALSRSLNIPFVLLLNDYGNARFRDRIYNWGLSHIQNNATHYGLTLILGGAEVTLMEMTNAYRNLGAVASNQSPSELQILRNKKSSKKYPKWNRECVLATLDALTELNRPDEEGNWKLFESARKIAWKTGTSFGFRDGWAIGITPEYTVGVWIGNANGEGQAGLTGSKAAAPLMLDIFSVLPGKNAWFPQGFHMKKIAICSETGNPASSSCPHVSEQLFPESCENVKPCRMHQILHLSPDKKYQANTNCFAVNALQSDTFLLLPPLVLRYYKEHHMIQDVPEYFPGCGITENNIHIIYPLSGSQIILSDPKSNAAGEMVLEITHRDSEAEVYWHLDENYMGSTKTIHQMLAHPDPGKHKLTVTDNLGQHSSVQFTIAP